MTKFESMKELNKRNKKLAKNKGRRNSKVKKCAMNSLKSHIVWLEKDAWYTNDNYPLCVPTRPSFSVSH